MGGSSKQTTHSSSTYSPDPYASDAYKSLFPVGQQLAEQTYNPQTGYSAAGFSPQQEAAFQTISNLQGGYKPYINAAAQYTEQGAAPISQDAINRYMNPYQQNVVDATMANLAENQQQQQKQILGNAISQGALGGGMTKAAQAELSRQQGLATGQTLADLLSGSYDRALAAAQTDAARSLAGGEQAANLGQLQQQLGLQGASAEYGVGAAQQQQLQNLYDVATKNAQQETSWPYQNLQMLANLYGGLGPLLGGTTEGTGTTTQKQSGGFGSIAGPILTGISLFADGGNVRADGDFYVPPIDMNGIYMIPTAPINTAKQIIPSAPSSSGGGGSSGSSGDTAKDMKQWYDLGKNAKAGLDRFLTKNLPTLDAGAVGAATPSLGAGLNGLGSSLSGKGSSFADGGIIPQLQDTAPRSRVAPADYYSPGRAAIANVASNVPAPLKFKTPSTSGKGSGLFGRSSKADGGSVYDDAYTSMMPGLEDIFKDLTLGAANTPEFKPLDLREVLPQPGISQPATMQPQAVMPQAVPQPQPAMRLSPEQPLGLDVFGETQNSAADPEFLQSLAVDAASVPNTNITAAGGFESGTSDRIKSLSNYSTDTSGSRSFGAYGLNTLPGNSAWQFRNEFGADLGITADPDTHKFKQQWDKAAKQNPQALITAEDAWYQTHVAEPTTRGLLNLAIPADFANDAKVQAFASDRVDQYGHGLAFGPRHSARWRAAAANSEGDVDTFLNNMAAFDKAGISADFRTYLKQHPSHTRGLENRINKRLGASLGIDSAQQSAVNVVGPVLPVGSVEQLSEGHQRYTGPITQTSSVQNIAAPAVAAPAMSPGISAPPTRAEAPSIGGYQRGSQPPAPAPQTAQKQQNQGGFLSKLLGTNLNLLNLDDNERNAMRIAGLQMMSSGDVGQGGLAGMQYLLGRQNAADAQQQAIATAQRIGAAADNAPPFVKALLSSPNQDDRSAGVRAYVAMQKGRDPTALQQNYAAAKQQGYQGSILDYQKELKKAGSTSVTVNSGKAGNEAMQRLFAKRYDDIHAGAANANEMLGMMDAVEQGLQTGVRTGALGDTELEVRKYAKMLGIGDVDKLGAGELITSLQNRMALAVRNPDSGMGMPGATSERDITFLKGTVPGIDKTSAGNALMIEVLRRLSRRKQDIAKLATEYVQEIDPKTGEQRGQLDAGFDARVRKFAEKNSMFNDLRKATEAAPKPTVSEKPVELIIQSDAEYEALPSGTMFRGPDGKRRRRP